MQTSRHIHRLLHRLPVVAEALSSSADLSYPRGMLHEALARERCTLDRKRGLYGTVVGRRVDIYLQIGLEFGCVVG